VLGRIATGAGIGADGGGAAARGAGVSELRRSAAGGGVLDLRTVPEAVRHVCNQGSVSGLRDDIQRNAVP